MVDDTETQRRADVVRGLLFLACPDAPSAALDSAAKGIVERSADQEPPTHAVSDARYLTQPRSADDPPRNLAGADLSGTDLTGADLRSANLTRASLVDANMTDADLSHADLTDADLTRTDLTRANLTDADLTRANLTNAYLTRTKLIRADLTGTELTGTGLRWPWHRKRDRDVPRVNTEAEADALRQAKLRAPALFGAELAWAMRAGDMRKIAELIEPLPPWPTRQPLLQAAQWLTSLTVSVRVADAAGVERQFTDAARASTESAVAVLSTAVVNLVSTAVHFGTEWEELPVESRRVFQMDAHLLDQISKAAHALVQSLGLAVAVGSPGNQALQNLHAFDDSIRGLTPPA
ncbi:pentapeptide repeat-containing protein [Streptomyces sp. NPDC005931]|uniref:pentapeptide repeat-containing protein n=1 Tax=Streptomyces sp. NPDC005931 TaxID=3364737 RepID=UPI00369A9ED2